MNLEKTTFFDAIISSPEWQAWVRQNEIYPAFPALESEQTGRLSKEHFEAFIHYAAEQHEIAASLRAYNHDVRVVA